MQEGITALSHMSDSPAHKGPYGSGDIRAEQGPDATKCAQDASYQRCTNQRKNQPGEKLDRECEVQETEDELWPIQTTMEPRNPGQQDVEQSI